MFKQTSTSLILLGILSVVVAISAFAWPDVTVYALVILFAVYAFLDAGLEAARAFSSRNAGPVFGHLLLGLISLAAGVVAVVWPRPTALVLVLVIGIWAVTIGIVEIVTGFGRGETRRDPGDVHPHRAGLRGVRRLAVRPPRRRRAHPGAAVRPVQPGIRHRADYAGRAPWPVFYEAVRDRVVIATPGTLMALLWGVAYGWQQDARVQQAQQIGDAGVELHRRLGTMVRHLDKLGVALTRAIKTYNDLLGSLEGSVLSPGPQV